MKTWGHPPLAIVAAVGRNGAIGRDNRLPWKLPSDLARFRELTMGKPMIMGRRTYQSIGRKLPGRESIVVTRDQDLELPDGVFRAPDADAALEIAGARAAQMKAREVTLIGGATLFETMMPLVDRLYMTFVDVAPEADVFFPSLDESEWRETSRITPSRLPNDEAACTFVDYVRARAAANRHLFAAVRSYKRSGRVPRDR